MYGRMTAKKLTQLLFLISRYFFTLKHHTGSFASTTCMHSYMRTPSLTNSKFPLSALLSSSPPSCRVPNICIRAGYRVAHTRRACLSLNQCYLIYTWQRISTITTNKHMTQKRKGIKLTPRYTKVVNKTTHVELNKVD